MTNQDAAQEVRYGEWFHAFITNSNENERQGEIMALLLKRLKRDVPDIFTHNGEGSPVFVDLMCGPGDMTVHYKNALRDIGLNDVRACGVELREDHAEQWRKKLGREDAVIHGSVTDPNLNITQELGLSDKEKPVAVFWGHGGYYIYQPKNNVNEQPALQSVVSLMHDTLGKNGVAFSVHKAPEWTDIAKRRFARLTESDTTKALHGIYDGQEIRNSSIVFECELKIPEITKEIREQLLAEKLQDYYEMPSGYAKTIRRILEFLVHTPLEELGREEFDKLHPANVTFEQFNHSKRAEYVSYIEEIQRHQHEGIIPTYVDFTVSVSPHADKEFSDKVLKVVKDVNKMVGKGIYVPKFISVGNEIESSVVGFLPQERERAMGVS